MRFFTMLLDASNMPTHIWTFLAAESILEDRQTWDRWTSRVGIADLVPFMCYSLYLVHFLLDGHSLLLGLEWVMGSEVALNLGRDYCKLTLLAEKHPKVWQVADDFFKCLHVADYTAYTSPLEK